MEKLSYTYAAATSAKTQTLAGVVSSGDLEVIVEPGNSGNTDITVTTSVSGFSVMWQATLDRIFSNSTLPAMHIRINDSGATPGVVRMRIEQAFEDLRSME